MNLTIFGPASGHQTSTLVVQPSSSMPDGGTFEASGKAVAEFIRESLYAGVYDAMMLELVRSEASGYRLRNPRCPSTECALKCMEAIFAARCEAAKSNDSEVPLP